VDKSTVEKATISRATALRKCADALKALRSLQPGQAICISFDETNKDETYRDTYDRMRKREKLRGWWSEKARKVGKEKSSKFSIKTTDDEKEFFVQRKDDFDEMTKNS